MASVTVIGPDKKTYEFPEGTTKDAAVAYFKRKGIGAAPDPEAAVRSQLSDLAMPSRYSLPEGTPADKPLTAVRGPFGQPILSEGSKLDLAKGDAALTNKHPGEIRAQNFYDRMMDYRQRVLGRYSSQPEQATTLFTGPVTGPLKVVAGISRVFDGRPEDKHHIASGINDVLSGAFETPGASLYMLGGGEMVPQLTKYGLAGYGLQKAMQKAGVPEPIAAVASNAALLLGPISLGAHRIAEIRTQDAFRNYFLSEGMDPSKVDEAARIETAKADSIINPERYNASKLSAADMASRVKAGTPALAGALSGQRSQASKARASKIQDFLGKAMMRQAREAIGQGVLDDMVDAGISPRDVTKRFWDSTYFKLPADQQTYFRNYLRKLTGFKPGDSIGVTADKQPMIAQDWADIANNILDVSDDPEHLEGSTRGLVALMKTYNDKFAAAQIHGGAGEPLTKAARIEEAAVKERPDWEAQERVHDQARLEAIVRNPEVSPEERNAAARSLEAGYPESTTALARRVAEGRIAIGEGGPEQARFIRSGQLGGGPPEPPTPPTEALVPPSGGPPPPAPPAETPMERDWSQFAKSATLQRSAQEVRANKVLATAFDYARRALAKLPYAERQEWANNMDEGIYQTGGILRRASEEAHNALNSLRDEMRRLNPTVLREYYENYWPRQWEMPNAAKQIYDSIRGIKGYRGGSLRGRASFLKPRTLLDEAGEPVSRRAAIEQFHMKPAYNNPIDEFMAKAAEMNRFIHGQNILNDLRDAGAKQTFLSARQVPEGWDQYDPRYAGPNQYGPADAVRVLNRYMRPSAFDSSDPYIRMGLTPLRAFNILSNQLAVSLSLFHAGLNITSGLVGDLGRALRHVPDLAEMGRSLSARSTIPDIIRAGKWQEAYRTPGIHGTEMERMIQQMLKGGAKPELDDFYRLNSTKRFLKAIEDHNPWGASARAIPALLEQLSRPIMDWLVPRVKMMAIMRDVETDLENNPNASDDELREMFARSVKSVDDWHGQMDRTNLVIHGWNRTMADALGTAFRFVEFSYGTMRGMYGAVSDLNLLRKGHLTPRLARAIAFPIVMYTMGATLQLMLTGKWPHDGDTPLRDGFEPRTGRINPDGTPERMELPTYWRTAVQWSAPTRDLLRGDLDEATTDLESALRGRLSGGVDSIIMWATNKDFYGRQVRQPHLELEKYLRPFAQLVDYAKAEVRENEPISLHYVQQAREGGEGARSIALRLAGIQPVPARENRSAAENKIAEFLAENMGDRPLTPEEYAARRTRSDIRAQLRSGKLPPSFASAITSHTINPARVAKFVEDARKSYYDRATELTPEQFLQVWELATPDERTKMKVPLYREYRRLMLGPLDERAKLLVPFQRALMEAR